MASFDDIISTFKKSEKKTDSIPKTLTVLPLRDIIIFPNMIFPILIGRTSSLKAVAEALERDKFIFVSAQKDSSIDEPGFKDVYQYGTTARILQILRLPNNVLKVLVEGLFQAKIKKQLKNEDYLEAEITQINVTTEPDDKEMEALIRRCSELFDKYIKSNHNFPPDLTNALDNIDDPLRKLYFAAANTAIKIEQKQKILELRSLKKQYFELISMLTAELEMLKMEQEIDSKVQTSIQKAQRKYYIQEQIRALQKELGDDEEAVPELISLKEQLENSGMPEHARAKAFEEFDKLKKIPTLSPEFSVNRTYLELLATLPWQKRTPDNMDIELMRQILDEDHYDLEKPKERILEYIAILNLAGTLKRQILCFVGPPGVGKTSLGRSIARGLGREFVRFSLGGVRDEAEIRGHRRTYIGALPGKIIQAMKKAGTINPVILLDEIDKMSMDFRGDPSSALLEVLDPEQNVAFNDHYVEVDYDLSNVLFITTANVKYDIPLPLQDRMEIIELSSYLDVEKLEIAKRHILPKLIKEYKLENFNIEFHDEAIRKIIEEYTREAGVRNLEREIASVLRKYAKETIQAFDKKYKRLPSDNDLNKTLLDDPRFIKAIAKTKNVIDTQTIGRLLKAPRFKKKNGDTESKIGVATGLAWTSIGGDTLPIEVSIMNGSEKLTLTGKLGDVMKESARAALTFVRSNSEKLGVPEGFYKRKEIHIHIPEGAIPKDGPSAGITMTMALISAAANKPLRGDVAMTGEITLRGNVLPIGGLNEKLLAAKRMGIKTIIIPEDNLSDIEDVNPTIKDGLIIAPVKTIIEALPIAFADKKNRGKRQKQEPVRLLRKQKNERL